MKQRYFTANMRLELKRMPDLPKGVVKKGLIKKDLKVFNKRAELGNLFKAHTYQQCSCGVYESGNYDGLDHRSICEKSTQAQLNNIGYSTTQTLPLRTFKNQL